MKKKLNVFCVLMLLMMAAQLIIGIVFNFSESTQAFKQGWEEGRNAEATNGSDFLSGLLMTLLALVCIFLRIRSFIAFIRFILNVNRDKVFVWENIPLLRWTGWGILIPSAICRLRPSGAYSCRKSLQSNDGWFYFQPVLPDCSRGVRHRTEIERGTGFNHLEAYGKNCSQPRCRDGQAQDLAWRIVRTCGTDTSESVNIEDGKG